MREIEEDTYHLVCVELSFDEFASGTPLVTSNDCVSSVTGSGFFNRYIFISTISTSSISKEFCKLTKKVNKNLTFEAEN